MLTYKLLCHFSKKSAPTDLATLKVKDHQLKQREDKIKELKDTIEGHEVAYKSQQRGTFQKIF